MGGMCSQPRERNLDIYAERRIWSSYSLENRDELEEDESYVEKRKQVNWPGVYGHEREFTVLKDTLFKKAPADEGVPEPGDGIGDRAIGLQHGIVPVEGIAMKGKYVETYVQPKGERVRLKAAHDIVWFDDMYDAKNERKTFQRGKFVKRGDEVEDPLLKMRFEDGTDGEHVSKSVHNNVEDAKTEDTEEKTSPDSAVDFGEVEDLEDSDIEIVLSESDDEDLRSMMKSGVDCTVDSPRSRFRVVSFITEGYNELQAENLAVELKKKEHAALLKKKLIVGATTGLTEDEILQLDRDIEWKKIEAKIQKRVEERRARYEARLQEQQERRRIRAEKRAKRDAEQQAIADAHLARLQATNPDGSSVSQGQDGDGDGHAADGEEVYISDVLDWHEGMYKDYVLGEPLFAKRKQLDIRDLEAQLFQVNLTLKDENIGVAERQNAIVQKQQIKRDIQQAKKELAAKEAELAKLSAEELARAKEAEQRRQAEAIAEEKRMRKLGEQLKKQNASDSDASGSGASGKKDGKSKQPNIIAEKTKSLGFGAEPVVDNIKMIGVDELRGWEARMLMTNNLDPKIWKSFLQEEGKYDYYTAPATELIPSANKNLKAFVGCMFIPDKTPVEVFHQLYDIEERLKWDGSTYLENTITKQYKNMYHNEVWYCKCEYPVMKPRDFVCLRAHTVYKSSAVLLGSHTPEVTNHMDTSTIEKELANSMLDPKTTDYRKYLNKTKANQLQAITYSYRSIVHPEHPEIPDVVRADSNGANLFVATPLPKTVEFNGETIELPPDTLSQGRPGTMFYLCSYNDGKITGLSMLTNSLATKGFKEWCKTFLTHMHSQKRFLQATQ